VTVEVVEVVQDPGVIVVGITESSTGVVGVVETETAVEVGVVETQVQVVEITSGTVDVVGVAEAVGLRGPAGSDADATALLEVHIVALEPHPTYDDMPTLRYIFENGLI